MSSSHGRCARSSPHSRAACCDRIFPLPLPSPQIIRFSNSVITINFLELLPGQRGYLLDALQVKFPHQRLVRQRERVVKLPRRFSASRQGRIVFFQAANGQHPLKIPDPNLARLELTKKSFQGRRRKNPVQRRPQPLELFRLLHLDGRLLICHDPQCLFPCPAGRFLERETGIEPATNSLEGCDSTTELLPPRRI